MSRSLRFRPAAALLLALGACVAATAAPAASLEGYYWPLSAAPGDTVTFFVSSTATYQCTFMRYHRVNDSNVGTALTTLTNLPAQVQAPPDSAWKGCGWSPSFQFVVPAGWASGIYGAELSGSGLTTFRMSFVVKPSPGAHGDFAVLSNTNTWSAYNDWGGRGKYTNPPGHQISFLRPNPYIHANGSGTNHVARAELWVLDWLTASGYSYDVYSDLDLHEGIPGLCAYKGLIMHTHPEYWSVPMVDHLEDYLDGGGCLLYMGGNAMYEKVVYSDDRTYLTFFPVYYDGTREVRRYSYYRNLAPPRPERAVLGVAYRSDCYPTYGGLQVLDAAHRFFAGTGVSNGSVVGASGLNGGGASGWEMDTSIPGLAADGVIVSCSGSDDRGSPPANIELLARGTNTCGYGADVTYYAHPGGGGVFSAGSLSFGGSLVVDTLLQHVVRNVLDEFLARTTGVAPGPVAPIVRILEPGRPNPFSSTTTLRFTLRRPGRVSLRVFDVAGRLVRTLVDDARPAGAAEARWDGRDDAGASVGSGIYLVRLRAGELDESRAVLRLR
jgi:hypothetical protein